jgi:hypothetical protein
MTPVRSLHFKRYVPAHAVNKRSQPFGVFQWLVRPQIPQDAQQRLLPDVFDQFLGPDGTSKLDPDGGAEMGEELLFGIRIGLPQAAYERLVECWRFQ